MTQLRVHHEMCMINEVITNNSSVTMYYRYHDFVMVSHDKQDLVPTSTRVLGPNIFPGALECLLQCRGSF